MIYFAASVFISAFLLFQIQPIVGKLLLPWFGGTPAVWSTVLLFFQLLLIGGYAYAYWLIGHVSQRRQSIIHLSVLMISLVLMLMLSLLWPSPIMPDASWKPDSVDFPIWHIFILLTISVGLPYFILATNAPLMQAWFSQRYPQRSPYRLYSLSNVGSLLALVSYPILLEPLFSIHTQGDLWSAGFVSLVLLVAFITVRSREAPTQTIQPFPSALSAPKPPGGIQVLWVALSACASIMLMAATNQITQEVAAIPFLWVLPLTIYLLSFILTFNGERWYSRLIFSFLLLVSSLQFIGIVIKLIPADLITSLGAYGFLLFTCCMICNGEAYSLRPHASHLTRFYLMLAAGGAIGGIVVNFVAPLIFNGYWELELGVSLCWLLLLILVFTRPNLLGKNIALAHQSLTLIATVFVCFSSIHIIFFSKTNEQWATRNFYGVIHVKEIYPNDPERHSYLLTHGATVHGIEFTSLKKRRLPTAYYPPESGIGLAIRHYSQQGKGIHVGVLGLGTGTLASYGQPKDHYRFYEINPAIIALTKGQGGYFHFLQDSRAHINIILGDARISLERELAAGQKQHFDILAMDTFSSDSIPLHLLTKEVFAVYLAHLVTNGVLAIHISNRNLELQPVVWQLAQFYHLDAIRVNVSSRDFQVHSNWVLLSHNTALLSKLVAMDGADWLNNNNNKSLRLWTDDYSNLLQIIK